MKKPWSRPVLWKIGDRSFCTRVEFYITDLMDFADSMNFTDSLSREGLRAFFLSAAVKRRKS